MTFSIYFATSTFFEELEMDTDSLYLSLAEEKFDEFILLSKCAE